MKVFRGVWHPKASLTRSDDLRNTKVFGCMKSAIFNAVLHPKGSLARSDDLRDSEAFGSKSFNFRIDDRSDFLGYFSQKLKDVWESSDGGF